jgi:hypothetical protein
MVAITAKIYEKLLHHPKWFKKRDRILKRDGYKCTVCGSRQFLRIHHTYYIQERSPWDYDDDALLTLCDECHRDYHLHHEITIFRKDEFESIKKKNKGKLPQVLTHKQPKKKKDPKLKKQKKKKQQPTTYDPDSVQYNKNKTRYRIKNSKGHWEVHNAP